MTGSATVGAHLARRLGDWGVRRFYGYPGDGIGGMVARLSQAVAAGDAEPAQVNHAVDRACRIALSRRTVTALILPSDVQQADAVTDPPFAHGFVHTSSVPSTTPQVPAAADLERAAAVLNAGERVAILAGAGAAHATGELTAVADRLGAGAAKALLGKTVLDDRLPWVTGAIGLLGTRPSWELMQECDTLLVVGTTMPYGEYHPPPGSARAVQIDIDGANNGLRYPTEVNLTGDSRATLAALLPLLEPKPDGVWRDRIAGWKQTWGDYSAQRVRAEADPVNPEAVVSALSDRLADDALLAIECGTVTCWFARDLALRPGQLASLSGTLPSMGGAMPYALAAKTAHPERPAFALLGDGAMQMNGLTELVTVAKYWRTWADPRLVVLVLNNRDLAFETWEVRSELGDRPDPNIQGLPDVRYADYARMLGLEGRRLERPEDIDAVWDAALAADRPFVIDAVVDPHVPIIPPHVTIDQLVKALRSQLRGDEALPDLVKEGFRFTVGAAARAVRRRWGAE